MKTTASPHAAILRAIQALICTLDREKTILIVEEIVSTDWASATFDGERHHFALRLEGEAIPVAAAMVCIMAGIGEANIPLHGQFVAEAAAVAGVTGHDGTLTIQPFVITALTIAD